MATTPEWSCRYGVASAEEVTPDGATLVEVSANIPECMTPGPTLSFTRTDADGSVTTHVGHYVGALGGAYCYRVDSVS